MHGLTSRASSSSSFRTVTTGGAVKAEALGLLLLFEGVVGKLELRFPLKALEGVEVAVKVVASEVENLPALATGAVFISAPPRYILRPPEPFLNVRMSFPCFLR